MPPNENTSAARFPVSYGIFRMARAHRGYAARLLRELGLYTGQELIVMALAEDGPQPQSRLVELERLDHSTIAHSLRRMETAGIVARKPSREDGRATVVSLTRKGRILHEKILAVWSELERASAARLDERQRAEFVEAMGIVERGIIAVDENGG